MGLFKDSAAATLPEGWIWSDCEDGSGSLRAPDGVRHFSYDKNERTYDGGISYSIFNEGNYSYDGTLAEFKKMAESAVLEKLNEKKCIPTEEPIALEIPKRYTKVCENGMAVLASADFKDEKWRFTQCPDGSNTVHGEAIDWFKKLEDEVETFSKKLELLKASYKSNKEDLHLLAETISRDGCLDNGLSEVSELFEQGYNNAFEYVFNILGIKY